MNSLNKHMVILHYSETIAGGPRSFRMVHMLEPPFSDPEPHYQCNHATILSMLNWSPF